MDFLSALKFNEVVLREDVHRKISDYIQNKVNLQNLTTFYQLAKLFNLTKISKIASDYIKRCFTLVVESKNFLELDYDLIGKLLANSELKVDTEIEIFEAAEKWLSYKIEERTKFAKSLLSKIRLPLLSKHALNYVITEPSTFSSNEDCVSIMKKALDNDKEIFVKKTTSFICSHRYYNQSESNILIFGGRATRSQKVFTKVEQINGGNFKNVKSLSPMNKRRRNAKTVCLKGFVYVFGGHINEGYSIANFERYSPFDDCWSNVTDMFDDRTNYSICAFMDKIYIFGGYNTGSLLNSTLQLDPNLTSGNKWKEMATMNQRRRHSASAVFEGKIIVTGGIDNNFISLNTVESYDVIGNEWSPMPNMIKGAAGHSLVVVKNKLYVVGSSTHACEFYDSICKMFVALKSNMSVKYYHSYKAINVGPMIYVFLGNTSTILCFDIETNKWSEESCEITENVYDYSIVNIPKF